MANPQLRTDFNITGAALDGLLKNVYLPALNNVTFHATPLLSMFGDFGGTIDFAGKRIVKAFKTQGAGGFGAITEGGDWVDNRKMTGFQGWEYLRYLNAYVELTGPAARTVTGGDGAFVDALSSAMEDTLTQTRQQTERIIAGDGMGILGLFVSDASGQNIPTTGSKTYVLQQPVSGNGSTTPCGGYSPAMFLQPGMRVRFAAYATYYGSSPSLVANEAIVNSVDYATGAVSFTAASSEVVLAASTLYAVIAKGAFSTPAAEWADSFMEPNGLYNLVSDGATDNATAAPYTKCWGVSRATYPSALKARVVNANGAELDEELLMSWVMDMANIIGNVPNVCVVDPKARLKYFSNQKDDRRFNTQVLDGPFGFRTLGVQIDQYTIMLQSIGSLRPGTLFLLNTNDFKFAKATNGFQWVTSGEGGVFQQKEGSDVLYASAVNYMNFVCENPRGQMKVIGLGL